MRKYRVLSLFSGAGGMDLGFIKAGFDIVWANDFLLDAVNTYKQNIGDHIVYGDITKIPSQDMPKNIDVVIGGFPCQGFSIANKGRSMEDKRNFLYREMLRVIKDKRPKFFIAENVKGLLSMEKGRVIEMILQDFKDLGYDVSVKLLNAADYGIPQLRERVIIMGNRIGKDNIYPDKTHYHDNQPAAPGLKPTPTAQETIGFLANVPLSDKAFDLPDGRTVYNHIASTNVADKFWGRKYEVDQHKICDYLVYWRNKAGLTTTQIDMHFGYKYTAGHWFRKDNGCGSIPKPSDWWGLKKLLGFDDTFDKEVTTMVEKEIKFEQSLRITNWDRPSDTITATSPEIHVNKLRRLSVRECALIQTFPMDFVFTGPLNKMYTQVGNAVPVNLAFIVAKCVLKQLED